MPTHVNIFHKRLNRTAFVEGLEGLLVQYWPTRTVNLWMAIIRFRCENEVITFDIAFVHRGHPNELRMNAEDLPN